MVMNLWSQRKNRPFTLVEVILVMAVTVLVLGSIGIAIPKALKKERFEKSVMLVQEKLTTAIDIMLDYDTDLFVVFQKVEGGVSCRYKTAKPLPEKAVKSLLREQFIEEVEEVRFQEGPLYFRVADCKVPEGIVTIVGEKNVEITCPGYPASMQKGRNGIKEIKASYPKEALSSS